MSQKSVTKAKRIFDEELDKATETGLERWRQYLNQHPEYRVKDQQITGQIGALAIALKHMAGKHPQKSHGRGKGAAAGFNDPTTRIGVMGTAVTYEDHAKLAKRIFDDLSTATQERILETEERIKTGTQTVDKYRDADGNWEPERAKLHDKIVAETLAGTTAVDQPEVIITGGLPGSGKSTVLKRRGEEMTNHVHVDSDAIKAKLPEYEGWNAALLHEEASHVVGRVIEQSVTGRRNVIYDATLKTASSSKKIVAAFEDTGYDSKVVFVDVPMESAMNRAVSRFMGPTNRYVPLNYLATHDTKNLATLDELKGDVDSWEHWDNSQPRGEPPTLVGKG